MLNITLKSVSHSIDTSKYKSFKSLNERKNTNTLLKVLIISFVLLLLSMFLPWTQNIRSNGIVTTLNPYDKPQNIQTLLGGQIMDWHVKEGDLVKAGDVIVVLSEAKEEYLDPELLDNTKQQQVAKEQSASAYQTKGNFLRDQLISLNSLQNAKLSKLDIEKDQLDLELESLQQELIAASTYQQNAKNQLERMQTMYDKGIKSLVDLETKTLSLRQAEAKLLSVENKLNQIKNKKLSILQEIELTISDYNQKVAKVESDIRSADSYRYSLLGESNKLQSKFNQIEQRQSAFVIKSPISGRITKVLKNGIGEYVKAKENIATIVPVDYQKAVELFIEPMDMPLMQIGKEVRLQFDGWPAIVFSGWPDNSFGTFSGEVFAIDNDISENGKYRIIVVESDSKKGWPDLIRIGSGARGLLLLKDVKIYYEIWRKLNGFPPDFYDVKKPDSIKKKAPLKKVK